MIAEDVAKTNHSKNVSDLQRRKPRSLKQRFGSNGPSPEQLAAHNAEVKQWNREYRAASKAWKASIESSNARWAAMSDLERDAYIEATRLDY